MGKVKLFFARFWKRMIAIVLLLAVIACSTTFVAKTFTDPQTYSKTIESIDEKKVTVLGVSAAIAGSATLLASVHGDATTPLAEEMMDLSSCLVAVVCVLVLEKSLLTVFGAVSCYFLFPVACLLLIFYVIKRKSLLVSWAIKLSVLALAFLLIVPTTTRLGNYIYEVNENVQTQNSEENIVDETDSKEDENAPWYKKAWNSVAAAVKKTVEEALEAGKKALNKFIDAVSVFIIAYCAIPLISVFLFLWLFKVLFGLTINVNIAHFVPRSIRKKIKERREEHPALPENISE